MKELIDMIQPTIVIQLRSSNPYFRHTMPDIDSQWSISAPVSDVYRQIYSFPLNDSSSQYEYHLLFTSTRQQKHRAKSSLTRQACLWSYFTQLESKRSIIRPLIDYRSHTQVFPFDRLGIGLLHRHIQPKYLLEVLNASIVALCRVKQDMVSSVT